MSRARALAVRAGQMEAAAWTSLGRLAFRRPRVPAGASGFSYHSEIRTILVVFIVLSAVEIPIIDLIVHPWPWVRFPLLALGIWGLVWMLGLLAGYITRPHAVGPEGLRVRDGAETDLDLPWADVLSIEPSKTVTDSGPRFETTPAGDILCLRMQDETTVLVMLERPVVVTLRDGEHEIIGVRFFVDDTRGYLASVREHLGAYSAR
ncbi:hypothetical protein MN032_07025 [Agromyces atrinae]|uniref:hypothetical protein n=1 Tax=Agromyces atrinae TaxID=592376 RepID=UPI001F57993A|nr:hypothetical protein [Agromyces atrinae]MCI2957437.1 hypothetical protein [Agromyces atrinae]